MLPSRTAATRLGMLLVGIFLVGSVCVGVMMPAFSGTALGEALVLSWFAGLCVSLFGVALIGAAPFFRS
ncbi:MAG TPA: hypothetical protein VNJ51_15285 [Candidatus Dormibacteraeota bacterium]|nr:hypothetical protein [Candidatus Dormibacteraeota bacterium]